MWGGGQYEQDDFYRLADEMGVMIWHDFMFSCALYPDDDEQFVREVRTEAEYQIRRLRNRAARSAVRSSVKSAREALAGKSADSATAVRDAIRALDRAVTKGILHRNTAARRKSALACTLNARA